MAILFVQQAGNDVGAGSGSVLASFGVPVTPGNVVVAFVSAHVGGDPTVSVAGLTGSPTWAMMRDSHVGGVGHKAIWKGSGFSGGTDVTMTPSASGRLSITVAEFSGVTTTEDGGNATGNFNTTPITGSFATANANDLLVAMFACGFASGPISGDPSAGFTALTQRTVNMLQASNYQIVSATSTYSATWGINAADDWEGLIAALQASEGGAPASGVARAAQLMHPGKSAGRMSGRFYQSYGGIWYPDPAIIVPGIPPAPANVRHPGKSPGKTISGRFIQTIGGIQDIPGPPPGPPGIAMLATSRHPGKSPGRIGSGRFTIAANVGAVADTGLTPPPGTPYQDQIEKVKGVLPVMW